MTINDRILTFFLNGLACAADARRNDRPKTVTVTVMYGFVVSWYLEKRVPVMWSFPRTFFFFPADCVSQPRYVTRVMGH